MALPITPPKIVTLSTSKNTYPYLKPNTSTMSTVDRKKRYDKGVQTPAEGKNFNRIRVGGIATPSRNPTGIGCSVRHDEREPESPEDEPETRFEEAADDELEPEITAAQLSKLRAEGGDTRYRVESIIGYREIAGTRQFLLKFEGFSRDCSSYEDYRKLGGLKDMINDYLRAQNKPYKRLRFPKIREDEESEHSKSEATVEAETEPDLEAEVEAETDDFKNMAYASEVVLYVKQYRKSLGLESGARFDQYPGREQAEKNKDAVYVLGLDKHFYVLYLLYSAGQYYIADGANACAETKVCRGLGKIIGQKLTPVEYNNQKGHDHCGSSAVLIGLYFIRLNIRGRLPGPRILQRSTTLQSIIEQRMHRGTFHSMNGRQSISVNVSRTALRCSKCNRKFKKLNGLVMHEKACK